MNNHPHLMTLMANERITERRRQAARFREVRFVRRPLAAGRQH